MNPHNERSYKTLMLLYKNGKLNFSSMTEQELSTILDYAVKRLDKKKSYDDDMTLIDDCLNALKRFETETNIVSDTEITAPIINISEHNNVMRHRNTRGAIALVAVIATLFLCTAVAYANGYNIFDIIFNRDSEQVIADIKNESGVETFEGFEQKSYSDVNTFIKENPKIALETPMFNDYDIFNAEVTKDDVNIVYLIDFMNTTSSGTISFAVTIFNDNSTIAKNVVEIDDAYSETFEISDIVFYLESNLGNNSVTWFNKNYSVKIYSNLPITEIKEIVNLYYGGQI